MGKELEQKAAGEGRGPGGTADAVAAQGGDPAIAAFIGRAGDSGADDGALPAVSPAQNSPRPAPDAESPLAESVPGADAPVSPADADLSATAPSTGDSTRRGAAVPISLLEHNALGAVCLRNCRRRSDARSSAAHRRPFREQRAAVGRHPRAVGHAGRVQPGRLELAVTDGVAAARARVVTCPGAVPGLCTTARR